MNQIRNYVEWVRVYKMKMKSKNNMNTNGNDDELDKSIAEIVCK
jgi:hypothetical protein